MFDKLLKSLVEKWKVEDTPPSDGKMLVLAASYSTNPCGQLMRATEANTCCAAKFAQQHTEAVLVFSCCTYTFTGAAEVEWASRRDLCARFGVKPNRAGDMENTVQEVKAIAEYAVQHNLSTDCIVAFTGKMHARSQRFILKKKFPGAKISIVCTPYQLEYQPDHPVLIQRGAWRWFAANLIRHALLVIFGPETVGQWHHRAKVVQKG